MSGRVGVRLAVNQGFGLLRRAERGGLDGRCAAGTARSGRAAGGDLGGLGVGQAGGATFVVGPALAGEVVQLAVARGLEVPAP